MKDTAALIVAGGMGIRLGKNRPKAMMEIGSMPMFIYPLTVFQSLKNEIGYIVLVTPLGWGEKFAKAVKNEKMPQPNNIVDGGPRRQDSVRHGLIAIPEEYEYVIIHDAARPFVVPSQVRKFIKLLARVGAVSYASRVRDTLREGNIESEGNYLGKMVGRENVWALGTPQGFRREDILKAHKKALKSGKDFTDDTALLSKKQKISIFEADNLNFKITYPEDMELAESLVPVWKRKF